MNIHICFSTLRLEEEKKKLPDVHGVKELSTFYW